MGAHHYNPDAHHDHAIWRWDWKERRWVRVTEYGTAWSRTWDGVLERDDMTGGAS